MEHDTGSTEISVSERGLTAAQRSFVRSFVYNGGNAAAAAKVAYPAASQPNSRGSMVLALPHVQAAIRQAQQTRIMGEGASKAVGLLISIMDDAAMPPQVRRMAARDMLEAAKLLGRGSDRTYEGDKPLTDMTKDEIAARIAALMLPEGPAQIEGAALDVTPDEAPGSGGQDSAST